jgi:NitT/TauT family transport system permease protein
VTSLRRAFWIRTALICACLVGLEAACRTGKLSPLSVIAPSEMFVSAWRILTSGQATPDLAFSLENTAFAAAISIFGGFAIGVWFHFAPRLRRAADPILAAYYAVPTFVLYPILIILFGLGSAPLVVIGSLFGVVSMIVSTLNGLDSVSPALRNTAAVLRIGRVRSLFFIQVPAASLYLVGGVKLAVAYSIIGVVAGEFILSTKGVGKEIAFAYNDFDTAAMYGYLVLLLSFVIIVNLGLQKFENSIRARWGL